MAAAPGSPLPAVLDVDTGVDDALALLYALAPPVLDLRAVTCVGGNAGLAQVLASTQAAGRGGSGQAASATSERSPRWCGPTSCAP